MRSWKIHSHLSIYPDGDAWVQGFNWESHKSDWYKKLRDEAQMYSDLGFTIVWMPPPTASVSREGYMPTGQFHKLGLS